MIFKYKRRIFGFECDIYGHLNNASYLHIYEEARATALEDMGIPIRKLKDLNVSIYLTRIEMKYIKSVSLEEEITLETKVEKMNKLRATWIQKIYNSEGKLCNIATVEGVFIKNKKPCRLSSDLFEIFRKNMDAE